MGLSFVWKTVCTDNKIYDQYKVSHSGSVVSIIGNKPVPEFKCPDGNLYVELEYYDGKEYYERVDSIVLCSHFRTSEKGEECEHVNGNKCECRLMNLKWSCVGVV